MTTLKFEMKHLLWLLLALIVAMAFKVWLIVGDFVPFNSDEAVVALMARHILQGARPIFFYGQAYMGGLDAYLIAGGFALFGQQVWVIRLVQSLLYLGVLITTAWLARIAFDSWKVAVIAALLLAIPTVNVTLYTTVTLGGYGEALLIGNLILITGLYIVKIMRRDESTGPIWLWGIFGILSGLGLWAFGLTLVYSLPAGIYLLIVLLKQLFYLERRPFTSIDGEDTQVLVRRRLQMQRSVVRGAFASLAALIFGGVLGAFPWWSYAIQHGFEKLIWELSGGAIAGVQSLPWWAEIGQHLVSLVLFGSTVIFGLRPPWDIQWLVLPVLPFIFIFWMAALVFLYRELGKDDTYRGARWLLAGVMLTLLIVFTLSPFGVDPSGRYFIPLAIPLSIFAAKMILDARERSNRWIYALVLLLLGYHFLGALQSANRMPPGITTQFYAPAKVDHRSMGELIEFLEANDERFGYTNYWVSYPLAFLSQEQLIFVPRLPYHQDFRYTARDDRYPPYGDQVNGAERVAYITTNHPKLNEYLRAEFSALGVTWQEEWIGDYLVFYNLSQLIRPLEIGLGETTDP